MEPIDRELEDRKERLKRMVIDLQRLEAIRPLRPPPRDLDWFMNHDEHDRKIIDLQSRISQAQSGIADLEDVIAEGRTPPRIAKPDTSRRRALSDEERNRIAMEERARLLKDMPLDDDWELHVSVERFTDLEGNPQIGFYSGMKPDRFPKPSRDS